VHAEDKWPVSLNLNVQGHSCVVEDDRFHSGAVTTDVRFKIFDLVTLLLDHVLDNVTNGNDTNDLPVCDRQVANMARGHNAHAMVEIIAGATVIGFAVMMSNT
jgi:hypothetical protein